MSPPSPAHAIAVELKHAPRDGVSLEHDLSETRLTLTRQRGGDAIKALVTVGLVLALTLIMGGDAAVYSGVFLIPAGLVLNLVKTEITLGPRAVRVKHMVFGAARDTQFVPYEAIARIETEKGRLGTRTLVIERVGADPIRIAHGTEEDHAELIAAIDARRPVQPLPDAADLQAPAGLRAMQARE